MHSAKSLSAAVGAIGMAASATLAQNVPVARNDVLFGLSRGTAAESIFQVRGFPTGASTGSVWNVPFIQSVELDNTDGFRHAHFGNLLGVNFGTTGTGGSIFNIQTNGATTPGVGEPLFAFTAGDPTLSRLGGISVSPNNARVAFTGGDTGRVYVMDYSAGPAPGSGAGASLTNLRSEVALGTGSTIATAWLDNNNVLALDRDGELQRVTVNNGTLSVATVQTLTFGATSGNPFTQVVYEPTVSPFVYALQGTFDTTSLLTVNELFVLDPANNFAVAGTFNYNTSAQTFREAGFDSRGHLYVGQFGSGTITPAIDRIPDARNIASLSNNSSVDYFANGVGTITASFNGLDVASTQLDYKSANVTVNVRQRSHVQQYFGSTPIADVRQKIRTGYNNGSWNGAGGILSSDAAANPGYAIGYAEAATLGLVGGTFQGQEVPGPAILFRYTRFGDANLDGTVNLTDFNRLAANFGSAGSWTEGDFNYDALVNLSDFNLLAANFGLQAAPDGPTPQDWAALAAAVVPEPSAFFLATVPLAGMLSRRRRVG